MAHTIRKTSETVASLVVTVLPVVFTIDVYKLTPKTYVWGLNTSDVAIATSDGTITDNNDGTYTITATGTYTITFSSDGIYKFNIVDSAADVLTHVRYAIINSELKSLLKTQLTNLVYCHPDVAYDCSDNLDAMYNTNVLSEISKSYFCDDINIAFNYLDQTSGYLYKDMVYECTNAGTGTRDFQDGSVVILIDSNFNVVPADTALTLNEVYTCIQTRQPDDWGSTTLKSAGSAFINRLRLSADAIDRVDEYRASCTTLNTCRC